MVTESVVVMVSVVKAVSVVMIRNVVIAMEEHHVTASLNCSHLQKWLQPNLQNQSKFCTTQKRKSQSSCVVPQISKR